MNAKQEAWLENTLIIPYENSFDDEDLLGLESKKTYQWAKWINAAIAPANAGLRELLDIPDPAGFLLVGPPGNGRFTTAMGAAQTLFSRPVNASNVIWTSGIELEKEEQEVVIGALREKLQKKSFRLCLIISNIMDCRWYRALTTFLCEQMDDEEVGPRLLLFLVEDRERFVPHDLLRRLQVLPFHNPTRKERAAYLENWRYHEEGFELTGISLEELAEETEGFSFRQLESMTHMLRMNQIISASHGDIGRYLADIHQLRDYPVSREDALQIIEQLRTPAPAAAQVTAAPRVVIQQVAAGAAAVGAAAVGAAAPGTAAPGTAAPGTDAAGQSNEERARQAMNAWEARWKAASGAEQLEMLRTEGNDYRERLAELEQQEAQPAVKERQKNKA